MTGKRLLTQTIAVSAAIVLGSGIASAATAKHNKPKQHQLGAAFAQSNRVPSDAVVYRGRVIGRDPDAGVRLQILHEGDRRYY